MTTFHLGPCQGRTRGFSQARLGGREGAPEATPLPGRRGVSGVQTGARAQEGGFLLQLLWIPGVSRCGPGGVACELWYEVGSSVGGDGNHPQPVELPGARP